MFKLYPDQQDGVNKIQTAFKTKKRVLYQLPTGGGKTVIFSHIAALVAQKFKRVCIISHRIELLTQAGGTLSEFGLKAQIITADTKYVNDVSITIAMTGTLQNRLNKIKWRQWWDKLDLIIVDEAHRSEFSWLKEYEAQKYKLGVTATPLRSGKMPQLADEYDELIKGLSVRELINLKRLLPDNYIGVPVDLTGVKKDHNGEFSNNQLFDKFNNTKMYSGIVENWFKYANGLCTIVFCVNIQHCIETARKMNEAGIGAKFITSAPANPKEPTASEIDAPADWTRYNKKKREFDNYKNNYALYSGERAQVIADWKAEKFPVLINAGIAVEGFDHKPIRCVVSYLATTSENKILQLWGRGSRVLKGKDDFLILDFGGNADRLGHYQSNRQYSLKHNTKISTGNTPYKNCPQCDSLIFISTKICEFCGYEYPEKKEAEFIELVATKQINKPLKELTFRELELMAQTKGYKSNWIWRTVYINSDEDGLKKYAKYKGYSYQWVIIQLKLFKK